MIVPRETPFNRIHLRNMLELADAGAEILPAMPAFYHQPATVQDLVDTVAGRVLDRLGRGDRPAPPLAGRPAS